MPREDYLILNNRPAGWSENFIMQNSPEALEQRNQAWQYVRDRADGIQYFDTEGIFNADMVPTEDGLGWRFGHMKASMATSRMMADDYWRGIMSRNAAADQIKAQRMLRGRESLKTELGGALTSETREHLTPFANTWSNWSKGFNQQGFWSGVGSYVDPLSGTGYGFLDTPDQLWDIKMPGYSNKKILEEMKEEDPTYYAYLMQRFGGEEALTEQIGEANNPDHFFYLLNSNIEQDGIQASLAQATREMEGLEEFWHLTAWPFLRDGLLNDPDMPASVALSLLTMGAGSVVGAGAVALKTIQGISRIHKFTKTAKAFKTLSRGLAHTSSAAFKVTDFLPENIATTLGKKYLWKNMPTQGFIQGGIKQGFKKLGADAVFNAPEGMIEGGLAEFFNQSLKIKEGMMDAYSGDAIWREAWIEGAFNVIANPLLGGMMKYTVGLAAAGTARATIGQDGTRLAGFLGFGDRMKGVIRAGVRAMGQEGKNPLIAAFDAFDKAVDVEDSLNSMLGTNRTMGIARIGKGGIDPEIAMILEPFIGMFDEANPHESVMAIADLLADMDKNNKAENDGAPMTPEAIVDGIIEYMSQLDVFQGDRNASDKLNDIGQLTRFKLAALRYFTKKYPDMPLEEAINKWESISIDNDEEFMAILEESPGVRDSIFKGMVTEGRIKGDTPEALEAAFNEVSAKEKFDWLTKKEKEAQEAFRKASAFSINSVQQMKTKIAELKKEINEATGRETDADTSEEKEESYNIEAITKAVKQFDKAMAVFVERQDNKKLTEAFRVYQSAETLEEKTKALEGMAEALGFKVSDLIAEQIDVDDLYDIIVAIEEKQRQGIPLKHPEEPIQLLAAGYQANEQLTAAEKGTTTVAEPTDAVAPAEATASQEGEPPTVSAEEGEGLTIPDQIKSHRADLDQEKATIKKARDAATEAAEVRRFNKLLRKAEELEAELLKAEENLEYLYNEDEEIKALHTELIELKENHQKLFAEVKQIVEESGFESESELLNALARELTKWTGTELDVLAQIDTDKIAADKKVIRKSEVSEELWNLLVKAADTFTEKSMNKEGKREKSRPKKVKKAFAEVKDNLSKGEIHVSRAFAIAQQLSLKLNEIKNYVNHQQNADPKIRESNSKIEKKILEIRRKQGRLARDRARAQGIADLQLQTIADILEYRKHQLGRLDAYKAAFEVKKEAMEAAGKTGFTGRQLSAYLPDGDMKEEIKVREDEISLDEATTILEEAHEKQRNYIRTFKPGFFRNLDPMHIHNHPSFVSSWNINAIGELPRPSRTNQEAMDATEEGREDALIDEIEAKEQRVAEDALRDTLMEIEDLEAKVVAAEGDNRGGRITKWQKKIKTLQDRADALQRDLEVKEVRSKEDQIEALIRFHAALVSIRSSHWYKTHDGLPPIAIVDAALPDSIFDTNLVGWFREAIRDIEGAEISADKSSEALMAIYDTLRVDVDEVLKLVSRALAKADSDIKNITTASLEALTKKLNDPRNKESKFGLITSVNLVRRLQAASRAANITMAEANGFVLYYTQDGGYEFDFRTATGQGTRLDTASETEFLSVVKEGFIQRLKTKLKRKSNWQGGKLHQHLVDTYNINPNETRIEVFGARIFDQLQREGKGVSREDIIKMGNGELSYQPAAFLGKQLFEFILTRDGLQPMRAKRQRDYRSSSTASISSMMSDTSGESESVLPFLEGELNIIAPEPLERIALILEDEYLRERIKFALAPHTDAEGNITGLETDEEGFLTDAVVAEYEKMRTETEALGDDPRQIHPGLKPGVRVRSYIHNATLHGKLLSREELQEALVEMLLEHSKVGYYFIHDNRYTSGKWRFMYREDIGTVEEGATFGDPTVVPMSGIGAVLALEEMLPHHAPLTEAVIEEQIKIEKEFQESHPDLDPNSDEYWNDLLSSRRQKDRKFNGYFVTKILGASSEEMRAAIVNIQNSVLKSHVPDMYIMTSLGMWQNAKDGNYSNRLGMLGPVLELMETKGITTDQKYEQAVRKENEFKDLSDEDITKLKALRLFLKNPVMTKLYEAGFNSFKNYYQSEADGMTDIWPELEAAGLVTAEQANPENFVDGIPEVMYEIGKLFYDSDIAGKGGALSLALGLEQHKADAKAILRMDERWNEGGLQQWGDMVEAMTGTKLADDHQLRRIDHLRDQFYLNLTMMAERRGLKEGTKEYNDFFAMHKSRIDKVLAKMDKADHNLQPGEDITPEQEAEILADLSPERAWKENNYFLAVNIMNSSGYQVATDIMRAQAIAAGVSGFSEDWLMGLQNYTLYQTFMPGEESHRTYPTDSSLNRHHHTIAWGKINSNPDRFRAWAEENITASDLEAAAAGDSNVMDKIWQYLEETKDEEESALGYYLSVDNENYVGPRNSMSKEEWEAAHAKVTKKVRDLMIRDELMGLAMYDRLPLADYTSEDNTAIFEEAMLKKWSDSSAKNGEAWRARHRAQSRMSFRERQRLSKVGQLIAPGKDNLPVATRGTTEHSRKALLHNRSTPLVELTDNPRGAFAWQPKMDQTSYMGLGNLELQRRLLDQEVEETFGPLKELQAEIDAEHDPNALLIPEEHRGRIKPWSREDLPPAPPLADLDLLDSMLGMHSNPAVRQAALMERDLKVWMKENDMEQYIEGLEPEKLKEVVPYLYLIMRVDEIIAENLHKATAPLRYGVEKEAGYKDRTEKELAIHSANVFKGQLMEQFHLARNIRLKEIDGLSLETKGHEIGITSGDMANMTVWQILTSKYDPNHKPYGHLLDPTLLDKALGFGLVAKEHFVISQGLNPEEGIAFKEGDTDVWPLIVQSHDFQSYLAEILWDSHITKAIQRFNETHDNKYAHVLKLERDPEVRKDAWNKIHGDDRISIINIARTIKGESNNPLFEMEFYTTDVEDNPDLVKLIAKDQSAESSRETEVNKFRNALGGPFSMLIRARRVVRGATIKFGLTPEGAMLMLAANTNQSLRERLELAYHTNKALGVKKDEAGQYQRVESDAQIIQQEHGFNMRGAVNKSVIESDAMKIMLNRMTHDISTEEAASARRANELDEGLHVLTDDTRKVGAVAPTVVDWTAYTAIEGQLPFDIQAMMMPLRNILVRLKSTGVGDIGLVSKDANAVKIIEDLLHHVTADKTSNITQVALMTALLVRDPKMTATEAMAILDIVSTKDNTNEYMLKKNQAQANWNQAAKNHRTIVRLVNLPSTEFFNTYYWEAKNFVERLAAGKMTLKEDSEAFEVFRQGVYADASLNPNELAMLESEEGILSLQAAFAAASKEQTEAEIPFFSEIERRNADYRNHGTFVKTYPELTDISNTIEKAPGLTDLHRRMLRAVVARVYEYNPAIITNLEFTMGGMKNFAEKLEGGKYKLGLTVGDRSASRLAYALAHEFAHVGYTKFIAENSGEASQWRALFLKEMRKPNLIRKVVIAAHGGVETQAALDEIAYYMNHKDKNGNPDPSEFMAALAGYYMLHDSLPPIKDLNQSDSELWRKTDSLLGRIINYIHRMMSRIANVFVDFKNESPDEWKDVQALIERTMGYGVTESEANLINNPATGPMYLLDESPAEEADPVGLDLDERLIAIQSELSVISEERMKLEAKIHVDTVINQEEARVEDATRLEELNSRRIDKEEELAGLGGNMMDPYGLTKAEYAYYMSIVRKEFMEGDVIDLEKLISQGENKQEIRAVASYMTRKIAAHYVGKDGKFMLEGDEAFAAMPWFNAEKNKLRGIMNKLVVGSTGAEYTWNSPFQVIVFLTTLVDNSMSTLAGHWGNLEGIPSVVGALNQYEQISTKIADEFITIENKITGSLETLVRYDQLFPDSDRATKHRQIRDSIAKEIIKKIENPEYQYSTDGAIVGDQEIIEHANNIVQLYTDMASAVIGLAKDEEYVGTEFSDLVPLRFATGKFTTPETSGALQSLGQALTEHILNSMTARRTGGKLDPFTMYAAGLLPSIADADEGLKMLRALDTEETRGLFSQIIFTAEATTQLAGANLDDLDFKEIMQNLKNTPAGDIALNQWRGILFQGDAVDRNGEFRIGTQKIYHEKIIPAVIATMKRMNSANPERGTMREFGIDRYDAVRARYAAAVTSTETVHARRIAELNDQKLIDAGLIQSTEGLPNFGKPVRGIDLHVRNMIAGAGKNVFFRNSWTIPRVSELMEVENVGDLLVYSPAALADGMMKSLGQNTVMSSFLKQTLGVTVKGRLEAQGQKTPVHALLNIFGRAFAEGENYNQDQTRIGYEDNKKLEKSIETLKEKLDVILGKNSSALNPDEGLNMFAKYAPDAVRMVYGTNLMMATMVVENSMNMVDQIFGRGQIGDFVMAATAPLAKMFGSKNNDLKRVAGDMAEIMRVFSQGFIPDYMRPGQEARNSFWKRLPQWLGERNMHMAAQVHEMIAGTRSVIFRRWITSNLNNGKLQTLVNNIRAADIKPTDLKGLVKEMKRARLDVPDHNIVAYMMNEGIFDSDADMARLQELIGNGEDGVYRNLDNLLMAGGFDGSNEAEVRAYRNDIRLLGGLKRAEKRFIEDVLISPNPFDINTTNETWNKMIEIFRRYPVLFAAQQMARRSKRFSTKRTVMHLTAYALFDMIYMNLLLLAAGYSPEDLQERWKEDPVLTAIQTITRLPHFGRYIGVLSEAMMIMAGEGFGRNPMGIISLSAATSWGSQIYKAGEAALSDEKDLDPHVPVMIMRVLPFIGAWTRAGWFTIMGADYQKPQRGTGGGGSNGAISYGSHAETSNMADYDFITREMLIESGMYDPRDPDLYFNLPPEMQKAIRDSATEQAMQHQALRGPQSPAQPAGGIQVPQQAPADRSPVRAPQDAIEQIRGMSPEEAPIEALK